jgi:hypothetical protein
VQGGGLLRQFLVLLFHVLLVLLQFCLGGGVLLTLKSVGMALRLLEAAMLSTMTRWRRYYSSIFFLEITGGVSTMRFPSW